MRVKNTVVETRSLWETQEAYMEQCLESHSCLGEGGDVQPCPLSVTVS